jgi:hypothetical protein
LSVHIGGTELASLKVVGELLVVDARKMEKSGLQVVDMHSVLHGIDGQGVAPCAGNARFDSTFRQPYSLLPGPQNSSVMPAA